VRRTSVKRLQHSSCCANGQATLLLLLHLAISQPVKRSGF
jgi:hypothetical protein